MIYVIRKEHFNAAHKLYNKNWSEEKNKEVFGLCANENWHGHNYELEVCVRGEVDPETGFLIDLKQLSKLIKERITDKVDHKNLNIDVEFMKGKMTTAEVIATEFWKQICDEIPVISDNRGQLHRITLYETPRNFVEYYGEK